MNLTPFFFLLRISGRLTFLAGDNRTQKGTEAIKRA